MATATEARPRMTGAEYVKRRGLACPFCGSSQVEEYDRPDVQDGWALQPVTCLVCAKDWTDSYKLSGYCYTDEAGEFHDEEAGEEVNTALLEALSEWRRWADDNPSTPGRLMPTYLATKIDAAIAKAEGKGA